MVGQFLLEEDEGIFFGMQRTGHGVPLIARHAS